MAYDLTLEFFLSAKPAAVMHLITDPVLIRKWSGEDAILENKEGGRFEMFDGWVKGTVLKTGKDELAYTWKAAEWAENIQPTEVHFLLKEEEPGTKVTLRHTGFPTEDEMNSHRSGWTDLFFDPLEDYISIFENK